MKDVPEIYVDWNDDFGKGHIGLTCSKEDIERQGLILHEGLEVSLYGDELEARAVITRLPDYGIWVAQIIEGTLHSINPDE